MHGGLTKKKNCFFGGLKVHQGSTIPNSSMKCLFILAEVCLEQRMIAINPLYVKEKKVPAYSNIKSRTVTVQL